VRLFATAKKRCCSRTVYQADYKPHQSTDNVNNGKIRSGQAWANIVKVVFKEDSHN
jgi:hypothetical protein